MTGWTRPPAIAASTVAGVARSTWKCPTSATGAMSQRPMQGAATTRTRDGSRPAASAARSASAPASAQGNESQTRTVMAGGGVSPSFTTSKWA